jgi:hypothetical protein
MGNNQKAALIVTVLILIGFGVLLGYVIFVYVPYIYGLMQS